MKTIEEKINEKYPIYDFAINISQTDQYEGNEIQYIKREAFRRGVELVNKWIPVEKELPLEGEKVLIKHDNGWTIGRLKIFGNGKKTFQSSYPFASITHWRPIERL